MLIGCEQGHLLIYNIRTGKLLYTSKAFNAGVRSLASSKVPHTIAVGLATGKVIVHNILYDVTLFSFRHESEAPVTALSFRQDGPQELVSGNAEGEVALWNLDKKQLEVLRGSVGGGGGGGCVGVVSVWDGVGWCSVGWWGVR